MEKERRQARAQHLQAKRRLLSALCVCLIAAGLVLSAKPAAAFGIVPPPVQPVLDSVLLNWFQGRAVKEKIAELTKKKLKAAADLAFKGALKVFLTNLAQDTAVWLASGGTGQKPFFKTDPKYFTHLADAAFGDFLDTIGTQSFGIDVCKPADPRQQYSIQSAVQALLDPANWCQNQCKREYQVARGENTGGLSNEDYLNTFFTVGQNAGFTRLIEGDLQTMEGALQKLKDEFNATPGCRTNPGDATKCGINGAAAQVWCPYPFNVPLQSCITVYEEAVATYKNTVNQDYQLCLNLCSAKKRVARCKAKDVFDNYATLKTKDFVPQVTYYFDPRENDIGQLLTLPEKAAEAQRAAEEADRVAKEPIPGVVDPVTKQVKTPAQLTGRAAEQLAEDPSGSAFGVYTGSPIADAIGVFTRTLTKRLLERIFSRGFNPSTEPGSISLSGGAIIQGGGAQAARQIIARYTQPDITYGGATVTIADLAACPESNPAPTNCVIDGGFQQAIQEQLTVQEAIDRKLLDPNKPFGYIKQENSEHPTVDVSSPNDGYSYRSMLILRRLRVVPVGWELAAQYIHDFGAQTYTLGQLVALFGGANCANDAPDKAFCGLVDPGWVLKAPETQCRVTGATAEFTSVEDTADEGTAPTRQITRTEACVDERSCLQEDEDGKCLNWGYCVKERPSWKFGGEACQNYFHSCDNFSDSTGKEAAYLTNTLSFSGCTPTNAGCQWYCQSADNATGAFTCTSENGGTGNDKAFYTNQVQQCPVEEAGCNEFLRTTDGTNLAQNGGFESTRSEGSYCTNSADTVCATDADCPTINGTQGQCVAQTANVSDDENPDNLLGWEEMSINALLVTDANAGAQAVRLSGTGGELRTTYDTGYPLSGQSYTLTFSGKTLDSACSGTFGLRSTLADGNTADFSQAVDYTSSWQRYTITASYDQNITYKDNAIQTFFSLTTSDCSAVIDDVQLELGPAFSLYKDYGAANKVYLNGKRVSCTPDEVGCELYTSATDEIPGIVTSNDLCTADMVGCRAFLEVPVAGNGASSANATRSGYRCSKDQSVACYVDPNDPDRNDCLVEGQDLGPCLPTISLIPSTGSSCSAADVGCEEYTNLDEVARGGEGKEYYTYIRHCAKPSEGTGKTYYTWLGSDVQGFQLKAYELVQDPSDGSPLYNDQIDEETKTTCTEAIFNDPTNDLWSPDCRQFYDAQLATYYKLYAYTMTVSDDCHPLRNTLDSVVYQAIPSEGTTCPATAAQCREYRGPAGYNTRVLIDDSFDDGDTIGWTGGEYSTESLIFGGGSMKVPAGVVQTDETIDLPSQMQQGHAYILSFWAGAASSVPATLTAYVGDTGSLFDGQADVGWDASVNAPLWKRYTLGPLQLDRAPTETDHLFIDGGGIGFYLDNIRLEEVTDSVYLIRGSYQLCAGNENCDQYTDRRGGVTYLKSFTRLCSTEKVGCSAFLDTKNADSPFNALYTNGNGPDGSSTKIVAADSVALYVDNPDVYCRAENQGCTLYGKPTLGYAGSSCSHDPTLQCTSDADCGTGNTCVAHDVTIQKYDATYLVDDPDQYANTLCKNEEVGCDVWKSTTTGATMYFRRPEPQTCEYKTLNLGTATVPNWYKSGTTGLNAGDACPTAGPAPAAAGDVVPNQPYMQPTDGWAGLCAKDDAGCREYRDQSEPEGCYSQCLLTVDVNSGQNVPVTSTCTVDTDARCSNDQNLRCSKDTDCTNGGVCGTTGCRGYWYIQQTVEDNARECNGTVNNETGCRAFYSPDILTTSP